MKVRSGTAAVLLVALRMAEGTPLLMPVTEDTAYEKENIREVACIAALLPVLLSLSAFGAVSILTTESTQP